MEPTQENLLPAHDNASDRNMRKEIVGKVTSSKMDKSITVAVVAKHQEWFTRNNVASKQKYLYDKRVPGCVES